MKKIISLLLAFVLMLSLVACGGDGETADKGDSNAVAGPTLKEGQLLAGYAKVDITPEDSVPLGGYGNTDQRMSTGFREPMYATILVLTDAEGNSAVIVGLDMVSSSSGFHDGLRTSIAQKLDIPESSVVLTASHMHSGPDMGSQHANIQRYGTTFVTRVDKGVDQAIADRAPADLYVTKTETEGLNFCRRYMLEGGIYIGYQSDVSDYGLPIVGYETEVDHSLSLLKFDRADDKTDIVVANFQTHPHRGGGASDTLITADLVGAFRDEFTAKLGYDVVYITGAAGDINPSSPITEHNVTKDYKEQGKALAKYAIDADGTYEKINGGLIESTTDTFVGEIDHREDHLVPVAKQAQEVWKRTNSISTVREQFLSYGIHSPYHAGAICSKATMGKNRSFDIWAISFGDVGLAVAPYEMFNDSGMFIKENSPFKFTMIAECANGSNGYFPTLWACSHGGYEPDTTRYVHGSAEILADQYVAMLNELYK